MTTSKKYVQQYEIEELDQKNNTNIMGKINRLFKDFSEISGFGLKKYDSASKLKNMNIQFDAKDRFYDSTEKKTENVYGSTLITQDMEMSTGFGKVNYIRKLLKSDGVVHLNLYGKIIFNVSYHEKIDKGIMDGNEDKKDNIIKQFSEIQEELLRKIDLKKVILK